MEALERGSPVVLHFREAPEPAPVTAEQASAIFHSCVFAGDPEQAYVVGKEIHEVEHGSIWTEPKREIILRREP